MPRQFDREMSRLREKLLTMAATAELMLRDTLAALVEQDMKLFDPVNANEGKMDQFQIEVDEEVVRLIGVYTPVAADLRALLMITRIATELERVGDLAMDISFYSKTLFKEAPLHPFADLPKMAGLATEMLKKATDAFAENSSERAVAVIGMDDAVDALHDGLFKQLMACVLKAPETITRVLELVLIIRSFKRMGDHAVNIAEYVVYAAKGQDIRHHHADRPH